MEVERKIVDYLIETGFEEIPKEPLGTIKNMVLRVLGTTIAGSSAEGCREMVEFYKAVGGAFDAVVCMYHDQGLIPFKLLHFEDGVNVTIGLPIVRTSVDHGTAYDIAGQGKANPASLVSAVNMAASIVTHRNLGKQ